MQEQSTEWVKERQPDKSTRARRLYWIVVGIPLLALLCAFPLVCSRPFMTYADKYGLTALRPLYETNNKPCDILLFGDSSTIIGLDPRVIQGVTHMSTCNIGATMPTLGLTGLTSLDSYLDRNPRPRVIVFQFSGATLKPLPSAKTSGISIEGIIPLLRYGNKGRAIKIMLKEPDTLIGLLHYAYVNSLVSLRARFITKRYPRFSEATGAFTEFPKPALTECPFYRPLPIERRDIDWVHSMRSRYASRTDHVLVNVAPTSSCNPLASQWQNRLTGEIDNQIVLLPISTFVDDAFHLTRAGAVQYSAATGREIVTVLARGRPGSDTSP